MFMFKFGYQCAEMCKRLLCLKALCLPSCEGLQVKRTDVMSNEKKELCLQTDLCQERPSSEGLQGKQRTKRFPQGNKQYTMWPCARNGTTKTWTVETRRPVPQCQRCRDTQNNQQTENERLLKFWACLKVRHCSAKDNAQRESMNNEHRNVDNK